MRIAQTRTLFGGSKLVATVVASAVAVAGFIGLASLASAANNLGYETKPLVASEWQVDRTAPSGGWAIEDFDSRETLRMSVDPAQQSDSTSHHYTEGLKTSVDADAASADLYVDSEWLSQDVRAGIWPVGYDADGEISAYPIIEYTTMGAEAHTGWRVWEVVSGGWTNIDEAAVVDGWNDLAVELNTETGKFDYLINGELVASTDAGDTTTISELIFNNYNTGVEGNSYDVRWSNLEVGQFVADAISPVAEIVTPEDGATVHGTVEVTGSVDPAEQNMKSHWFEVKGPEGYVDYFYNMNTTDLDWSFEWDTTQVTDGEYTIRYVATDQDGNRSDAEGSEVHTVQVNNVVDTKADCKQGGWEVFLRADGSSFKNQGQCVAYVSSNDSSKHHRN